MVYGISSRPELVIFGILGFPFGSLAASENG
jgi:hypothetical protein